MNIYNYDEKTKEYLSTTIAEADPEEIKLKGKFVPLVPANATLIEVPEYGENEIPVFENENWVIKPDYRINFYKVDDNLSVQEIKTIGDQEGCYIVDKTTGDLIKQNPDKFKIVDNQVIAKTDEEYQAEQAEKQKQKFYDNFVVTTWGAFRKTPKGYSSAVEAVNTVFNMVNVAQAFTEELAKLLIFYEVPDFADSEQCTEEWLISNQKNHEACDLHTFMSWYLEFQTVWAQTQYTDIPIPQMEV